MRGMRAATPDHCSLSESLYLLQEFNLALSEGRMDYAAELERIIRERDAKLGREHRPANLRPYQHGEKTRGGR